MKLRLFVLISVLFLIGCKKNGLPLEYPLEKGTAMIYETTNYNSVTGNTIILDTLFITEKIDDYYLCSWNPQYYYFLMKNFDNKFIHLGVKINGEIQLHEKPIIWFFYGKNGTIDESEFLNYRKVNYTETISIEHEKEYLGNLYDTYVSEKIANPNAGLDFGKEVVYYNKLGTVLIETYDLYFQLKSTTRLIKVLKNTFPEE